MRRTPLAVVLSGALTLSVAPAAHANAFEDVYAAYQKSGQIDPCKFSAAKLKQAQRQVPPDIDQYAPDFEQALDRAAEARTSGACDRKASSGEKPSTTASTPAAPSSGGSSSGGSGAGGSGSSGDATGGAAPDPAGAAGAGAAPAAAATPSAATPQPAPDPVAAPAAADQAIPVAASAPADEGAGAAPVPLVLLALLGLLLLAGAALAGAVRFLAVDPPWLSRWRHATAEAGWRASNAWAEFTDWVRLGR